MTEEHRKAVRHEIRFKIIYDDGSSYNAGYVADVSETGLYLESAYPLKIGTQVRLEALESFAEAFFELEARVVRCVALDPHQSTQDARSRSPVALAGIGLEFVGDPAAGKDALARLLKVLEKRAAEPRGEKDPFLGVRVPLQSPPRRE